MLNVAKIAGKPVVYFNTMDCYFINTFIIKMYGRYGQMKLQVYSVAILSGIIKKLKVFNIYLV